MKQRHDDVATGWLVGDINGDVYPRRGDFPTREACTSYISKHLDGEAQNEYGMDSMFDPVPVPPPGEALADVLEHAAAIDTGGANDAGASAARWDAAVRGADDPATPREDALREVIGAAAAVHAARTTELDELGPERDLIARLHVASASMRISDRQRDAERGGPDKPIRQGGDPATPPAPERPAASPPAAPGARNPGRHR